MTADMMIGWFRWLDVHPAVYWVVAGLAAVLFAGWLLAQGRASGRRPSRSREAVTALLLLAVILAWRWPPLFHLESYNPDEAQVIAGALTLDHDWVFWRSLDGNTSGPLNFYALLPTHWLGVPQNYLNGRLTGLLLVWGALWACYRMLRLEHGPTVAMVGVLPGVLFITTTTETDFLQYSTEHLSFCLLAWSASLLWQAHRQGRPGAGYPLWPWLGAGLLMGMLPWAKLQAAPLAAGLAAWGAVLAWRRPDHTVKERIFLVARLAAAALLPGGAILLMVGVTGQWEHFVHSYVVNNLAYVDNTFELWPTIRNLASLSLNTWNFPGFVAVPVLTVLGAGLALGLARRRPTHLFVMGGVMTILAVVCVLVPKRAFSHYLFFLVVPLTWWGAAAYAEIRQFCGRARLIWAGGVVLVSLLVSLAVRLREPAPLVFGNLERYWRPPEDEAARILRALRQPGDTMAVWGWNSHLHVLGGMGQGTREAVSERQLRESDQRDSYYRPRYLADLRRNRPAFFVDAVGPGAFGFCERETEGHESFPELGDFIAEHYALLQELYTVRVYMRADLVPPAQRLLDLERGLH